MHSMLIGGAEEKLYIGENDEQLAINNYQLSGKNITKHQKIPNYKY
jgi:hypothetical protein